MDSETSIKSLWGPWSPDLKDATERRAQLRCLAGLVRVITKGNVTLVRALRAAEVSMEFNPPSTWNTLEHARRLFDALPTLEARQIIATFAAVHAPPLGLPPLPPVKIEGEPYSDDPGAMLDPFPYE